MMEFSAPSQRHNVLKILFRSSMLGKLGAQAKWKAHVGADAGAGLQPRSLLNRPLTI